MIAKECPRGARAAGLVRYLMGPGRKPAKHLDPRVIAAWDESWLDDPRLDDAAQLQLAAELDAPRRLFGHATRPDQAGHVYHLAVRTATTDRTLTDDEFAQVARAMLDELGLTDDPQTGRAGCRWVVIRHADDHVHVEAVLVREDGEAVAERELWRSRTRLRAHVVTWEGRLGLRHTGQGADVPDLHRGEIARAASRQVGPARRRLAQAVRVAATQARDEADFVDRLTAAGIVARPRWAAGGRDTVVGYSVAYPPEADGDSWIRYGGGRLARDLTLPALRTRWQASTGAGGSAHVAATQAWQRAEGRHAAVRPVAEHDQVDAELWTRATAITSNAARALAAAGEDRAAWAAAASDAAATVGAIAAHLEPSGRGRLTRAADALSRAAQQPGRPRTPRPPALRGMAGVARVAASTAGAGRSGGDSAAGVLALLHAVGAFTRAVEDAHRQAGRAVHAHAAAEAAAALNRQLRSWREGNLGPDRTTASQPGRSTRTASTTGIPNPTVGSEPPARRRPPARRPSPGRDAER